MSTASVAAQSVPLTAEGARRHQRAWRTAQASLAARAVSYTARLVSIPLALHLLGAERYGLWLTASSLIAWLGFADLGLGSGLVNALAAAQGRSDTRTARQLVSAAFAASAAVACVLALAVAALSGTGVAARLLGAANDPRLTGDARAVLLLVGLLFAASFALNPVNNVCAALQEGYRTHIAAIAATLASLAVLAGLHVTGATLTGFTLAMVVPSIAATLLLALGVFCGPHRALAPRWSGIELRSLGALFAGGGPLFFVALSDLSVVYSINVLIAARFGAAEVPRVAVPLALCSVFVNVCGGITQPYWPACVDASQRRDWLWLRAAASRLLRVNGLIVVAGALGIVSLGREFLRLWAGPAVVPSQALLNALAMYAVAQVFSYIAGVLLMGLGRLGMRAALHAGATAVHWGGFCLLAGGLGPSALPIAGTAGYGLEAAIAAAIVWRALRRAPSCS